MYLGKIYQKFINNGGDGFWWPLNQHQETVMVEKPFYGKYIPSDYPPFQGRFDSDINQWPVAELQPNIMQLKTGYRDIKDAENAVNALKTIEEILDD